MWQTDGQTDRRRTKWSLCFTGDTKTVIATLWHNNKAIISLNDQTNIQGHLAWVKSTCIDRNTGCQIKQLSTHGTWFYVRNSECTGFRIHRETLYVSNDKIPLDQNNLFGLNRISEYTRFGIDRLYGTGRSKLAHFFLTWNALISFCIKFPHLTRELLQRSRHLWNESEGMEVFSQHLILHLCICTWNKSYNLNTDLLHLILLFSHCLLSLATEYTYINSFTGKISLDAK